MKKISQEQMNAELEFLRNQREEDIDTSDAPEISDWSNAVVGKFYRPIKKTINIRLDLDVISWFKEHANDKKYQSMINDALRSHISQFKKSA